MILLLLMGLGAAGVKAQVRIGGNTPPSAAAVLDLNASDAANLATGGLVLPRVDLKSNVMQLTSGVANQTGTMVYNVTTTLGRIGVYYWNGNSWVLASLPSTSAGDSGAFLMSTGAGVTWRHLDTDVALGSATVSAYSATSWLKVTVSITIPALSPFVTYTVTVPGMTSAYVCTHSMGFNSSLIVPMNGAMRIIPLRSEIAVAGVITCFAPS